MPDKDRTDGLVWIAGRGSWQEKELVSHIKAFCSEGKRGIDPSYKLLGYFVHRFCAADGSAIIDYLNAPENSPKLLLEMRIFNENRELWIHRSRIGENVPFFWREASDTDSPVKPQGILKRLFGMGRNDDKRSIQRVISNPEKYRFETRQMLDINGKPGAADKYGCLSILSTVGGHFALPIAPEDRYIRIINYIQYDTESGMGNVADYRFAGFSSNAPGVAQRKEA